MRRFIAASAVTLAGLTTVPAYSAPSGSSVTLTVPISVAHIPSTYPSIDVQCNLTMQPGVAALHLPSTEYATVIVPLSNGASNGPAKITLTLDQHTAGQIAGYTCAMGVVDSKGEEHSAATVARAPGSPFALSVTGSFASAERGFR